MVPRLANSTGGIPNANLGVLIGSSHMMIGPTTNDTLYLITNNLQRLSIDPAGKLIFPAYGSGTNTGTLAYTLGVTSTGKVIETSGEIVVLRVVRIRIYNIIVQDLLPVMLDLPIQQVGDH